MDQSIADMPFAVLKQIAKYVPLCNNSYERAIHLWLRPLSDVLNLRFASRAFGIIGAEVLKQNLTRIYIHLSRKSLDTFCEICERSTFGQAITEIIVVESFYYEFKIGRATPIHDTEAFQRLAAVLPHLPNVHTLSYAQRIEYPGFNAQEALFSPWFSACPEGDWTYAFEDSVPTRICAMNAIDSGIDYVVRNRPGFLFFMQLVGLMQGSVRALNLGSPHIYLTDAVLQYPWKAGPGVCHSMQTVEELRLALVPSSVMGFQSGYLNLLLGFLRSGINLTVLELHQMRGDYGFNGPDPKIAIILRNFHSINLRSFSISLYTVFKIDLELFLMRHQATLRHIDLQLLVLHQHSTATVEKIYREWRDILMALRHNMTLDESKVWITPGSRHINGGLLVGLPLDPDDNALLRRGPGYIDYGLYVTRKVGCICRACLFKFE